MTQRVKQAGGWAIAGVIVAICGFLITNVLASKPEVAVLRTKVERVENDISEIRTDVKTLLQRIPAKE